MKRNQWVLVIGVVLVAIIGGFYFNNQQTTEVCIVDDVVLTSSLQFKDADRIADLKSSDELDIEIKSNCDKVNIKLDLYSETSSSDPNRMRVSFSGKKLFINDELVSGVVIDDLRLATTVEKNEFRVTIKDFDYEGNKYSSTFEFKRITDGYELMNKEEILVIK